MSWKMGGRESCTVMACYDDYDGGDVSQSWSMTEWLYERVYYTIMTINIIILT